MTSLSHDGYLQSRDFMVRVTKSLKENGARSVFYAGEHIESREAAEQGIAAVNLNFPHLKQAEHVILFYPERVASSSLMELGYALALGKSLVVFVKNRRDLPHLLQDIDSSSSRVKIREYDNDDEALRIIKGSGMSLFLRKG